MTFTFFFRDRAILEMAVEVLEPFIQAKEEIKIWDAGCSYGEEPYSLAILLAERMGLGAFRHRVTLYASDTQEKLAEKVGEGIYPKSRLERLPKDIFEKYFRPTQKGEYFQIISRIRERVFFRQNDLRDLRPVDSRLNGILCKNVLLHIPEEEQPDIFRMYYRSLKPGGFLGMELTQPFPREMRDYFRRYQDGAQFFTKS